MAMKLSDLPATTLTERYEFLLNRNSQLEGENETLKRDVYRKEFAIKQVLMAYEEGYYAPKIWQDLRDALLGETA